MPKSVRRWTSLTVSLCLVTLVTLSLTVVQQVPSSASLAPPANPEIVYVVNSPSPEIGLTNYYGTQTTTFAVAVTGPVSDPQLSPDGSMVAFVANCDIYTVNSGDFDLHAFAVNAPGTCLGDPAWSPNGAELVYDIRTTSGSVGLWVSNADGSDGSQISPNGAEPSWDPTGTRIAFVADVAQGGEALETVSASGGLPAVLLSVPPGGSLGAEGFDSPQWSPDGTTIAYVATYGFHSFLSGGVSLVDADGSHNRGLGGAQFDSPNAGPFALSWCPSGACLSVQGALVSGGLRGTPVISATNGGLISAVASGGTDASFVGVASPISSVPVQAPTVGAASTADGRGVWTAGGDGGVFTYGDALFHGSMGGQTLNAPIVGMAATAGGGGYWEVAKDGGIFSFGDAQFQGSMGGQPLNKPVVGMAADPATGGYWEVASDGGIFSFNAPFLGSMGGQPLNQPIVGMAATPDGSGYWLVAADGGIFAYGDAAFLGSMGGQPLNQPVVGMAPAPSASGGYWEVARDGGVFSFGGAPFDGSPASTALAAPIVALLSLPGIGYGEVTAAGGLLQFQHVPN